MRKFFGLFLVLGLFPAASAENMSFVTTLSHPVGTFATVESLNDKSPVQSLQVNFCNTKVGTGNIDLGGAMRAAYLKTLPNTQLGGSVPAYQLKTLYVGNNNTLTGGNIVANTANPGKAKVSQTLYAPDMTYLVAELPALKIKNGSNVNANIKSGGANTELEWGNQYANDYKVDSAAGGLPIPVGSTTYSSYLLKSKVSSGVTPEEGIPGECCQYDEQIYTKPSEYMNRWDDLATADRNLREHESCTDYNPTQGTNYNCKDNAAYECYERMDYDCPNESGSLCGNVYQMNGFNVYFSYRRCNEVARKPCKDVSGDSSWQSCVSK